MQVNGNVHLKGLHTLKQVQLLIWNPATVGATFLKNKIAFHIFEEMLQCLLVVSEPKHMFQVKPL